MPDSRPFTFAFAPTVAGGRYASAEHVEPFRRYLERALEQPVRTALPASYRESFASLRAGRVDAAMVGDLASREGEDQGGVEPLVSEVRADSKARTYRSAFATRNDTGIRSLPMLRGRLLGLVDGSSTSGYLVPRAMLHEAGIEPDRDLEIRVFGSHREVVDALLDGLVDAGAMHEGWLTPDTIDRGPEFARLRVLARSGPIPAGPMVVRSSLDPDVRSRLRDAMLRIHEADPAAASVMLSHGHRFTEAHRRAAPTLKSIASLAGVSYATVSRVANASGYVAPETARRVRAIIDEVGYAPNGNARVLLGRQLPLVGMVVAFGDEALAGILPVVELLRGELERQGVPFVLYPVGEALDRSLVADLVRDKRLGALIVTGAHAHDPLVTALARTGHPVFALAPPPLAPGMIAAAPDEITHALLAELAID